MSIISSDFKYIWFEFQNQDFGDMYSVTFLF